MIKEFLQNKLPYEKEMLCMGKCCTKYKDNVDIDEIFQKAKTTAYASDSDMCSNTCQTNCNDGTNGVGALNTNQSNTKTYSDKEIQTTHIYDNNETDNLAKSNNNTRKRNNKRKTHVKSNSLLTANQKQIININIDEPYSPLSTIETRKLRDKYHQQFITSISNEHCNTRSTLHKESSNAVYNTTQNIKTLNTWLTQIKQNGISSPQSLLQSRRHLHSTLTNSVRTINSKITANTKYMRRSNNSTLKYVTNANQTKTNITKRKKESSALLQDILSLKEQTQQYRKQLDQIKHETSLINESITTETNDILHIQTHIKDLTKSIHILTKDKDTIRNEVNAITKQLKSLRLKVNNFYYKNSSLMLNVNQLIHDNNL
jgi:hypothetical protein